jgi:predicted DNA-binding transcriptional regulator AlpA
MSKTNRTEAVSVAHQPTFASAAENQPATHKEDPLLNLSEAARRIGKAQPTIRRWITEGLLKAHRLPSGLFAVRESAVNDILRIMENG